MRNNDQLIRKNFAIEASRKLAREFAMYNDALSFLENEQVGGIIASDLIKRTFF